MDKLSIIIPAFNEGQTIYRILDKVKSVHLPLDICKEVIIINDFSTDNTDDAICQYKKKNNELNIQYFKHPLNKGKGVALHAGIEKASCDYIIIQDADPEYNPQEYTLLLLPLLDCFADMVYGSRFIGDKPHRVLLLWHTIGNRFLTVFSNMFSSLNLTDMETCNKLIRSEIVKPILLKENRFKFAPEVTAKIGRI